ncbi:MAG: synthase subunit [Pseudomonadota bacterium]
MSIRAFKHLFFALSLTGLTVMAATPHTARADAGEHAEHDAEEEAGGAHGHHGPVTLHSIVAGEEALQFWGSVVNFILLLVVIRRLSRAPLSNFLKSRRDGIERGISEASEVKAAAETAFNTYNERMKSLDGELAKLRKDVAEAAERDRARIVAEANDTVARLKAETETLIQRQGEQLEAQIRREVVAAAGAAAEKAVRELSTAEDQARLADAFVREITKAVDTKKEKRA